VRGYNGRRKKMGENVKKKKERKKHKWRKKKVENGKKNFSYCHINFDYKP
jgi:hypothetical protein